MTGSAGNDLREALVQGIPKEGSKLSKFWIGFWTILLFWGILAIGIDLAMLGPTLQELANQLDLSLALAGSLFTWRATGYLVGSVWCGDLMHRFKNAGILFAIPMAICAIGVFFLPQVTSYPIACVIFLFQGIPMGMFDTGGNVVMLALWRGSDYQNGFVHAFHFFFGIGAMVAPLVVRVVLSEGLYPMIAWEYTGEALALTCVGLVYAAFFGPMVLPEDQEQEQSAAHSRIVTLTGLFLFIYVGVEVSFGGYVDVFSVRQLEQTKKGGATLTSVYWGALSAGRLLATAVTSFVNHVRYLALHLVLTIASLVALAMVSLNGEEVTEVTGSLLGVSLAYLIPVALIGFALGPLFPGAILVLEELLGRALPSKDAGKIVGMASAGEMILPLLVGTAFSVDSMCFCWVQLLLATCACAVFFSNSREVLRH